ncbi:hypothetical protein [Pseudomonas sp.]|uniref:hypothetical protein n=1 Tax=Pseudomonas sp. TaxID=306 RepID=UPI00290AC580|nr:hypothetical protein [Pseudomonas sp.]MDU4251944.1 hypothetical protein [Pseudomonas sp.]
MNEALVIFLLLAFIGSVFFAHLANKIRRRKATYSIYEARDKFILLVASGKIEEDSPFFKYYYKRINSLLSHAPDIGLDDAVRIFLKNKENGNFAKSMKEARAEHEKILSSKEMEIKEASEAAHFYYLATREMILAHSSLVRMTYYALSHVGSDVVRKLITDQLPKDVRQAVAVAKFSTDEASYLGDRSNFAH